MSIWIIIALLNAVYGLASLPRDIRNKDTLQTNLDIALMILSAMALILHFAS